MTEPLIAVHLYGPLADKYGDRHAFAIQTPREAVAALAANYPGFIADFSASGIYYIHADGDWRDGEAAATMPVAREIHLVPQVEGEAFLGALAIGALFPAIAGTMTATIIGGLLVTGLLVGLSFLLRPKQPKQVEDAARDEDSYAFSGAENVTAQGVAVPLVYGRVHCGSVVVSAGLEARDVAPATNRRGGPPMNITNAPPFPGGLPPLTVVNGVTRPFGWIWDGVDQVGAVRRERFAPSPQPVVGWFYYWSDLNLGLGGNGFYVTQGI